MDSLVRKRLRVLAEGGVSGEGAVGYAGYCKLFAFQAESDQVCDSWAPMRYRSEGVEDAPRYRAADTYVSCENCVHFHGSEGA